jgi:hypothetical protein
MPIGYSYLRDWLPQDMDVFDPHEWPKRILNSFQNWVHNKLFRASFVHEHNLAFQPVHRTADLLFTCRALTEAHRIGSARRVPSQVSHQQRKQRDGNKRQLST